MAHYVIHEPFELGGVDIQALFVVQNKVDLLQRAGHDGLKVLIDCLQDRLGSQLLWPAGAETETVLLCLSLKHSVTALYQSSQNRKKES